MLNRRSIAGALIGTALLMGCGSSSNSTTQFKGAFQSAENGLSQTSDAIGLEIQSASSRTDAQLATAFHALAVRWQSQLSHLETLTPPANVASDFNTLRDAATRAESDLNAIVSAAATHSKGAAEQGGASIVQDVTAARQAAQSLDQKLGIKPAGATGQ